MKYFSVDTLQFLYIVLVLFFAYVFSVDFMKVREGATTMAPSATATTAPTATTAATKAPTPTATTAVTKAPTPTATTAATQAPTPIATMAPVAPAATMAPVALAATMAPSTSQSLFDGVSQVTPSLHVLGVYYSSRDHM